MSAPPAIGISELKRPVNADSFLEARFDVPTVGDKEISNSAFLKGIAESPFLSW
jgi:hypothetical protein